MSLPRGRPGRGLRESGTALVEFAIALPLLLLLWLLLYTRPFELVVGGRDPGIYINTAARIAARGGLAVPDAFFARITPEKITVDTVNQVSVQVETDGVKGGLKNINLSESYFRGKMTRVPATGRPRAEIIAAYSGTVLGRFGGTEA